MNNGLNQSILCNINFEIPRFGRCHAKNVYTFTCICFKPQKCYVSDGLLFSVDLFQVIIFTGLCNNIQRACLLWQDPAGTFALIEVVGSGTYGQVYKVLALFGYMTVPLIWGLFTVCLKSISRLIHMLISQCFILICTLCPKNVAAFLFFE